MPDLWHSITDGFMPHGYCLHWDGPLLTVFIAGNLGIAIAYFLIPVALFHFIGQRKDLPYPHMFKLFAVFILSCGCTHLAKIWTIFTPAYWIESSMDLWTALVSMATAVLLFPLIPKALMLRSPKELEEANRQLQQQIDETKKAQKHAEEMRKDAETSRDEAVRANKLKSEFVANISHEIRTPMSGVIGMAELLTRDPEPDEVKELSQRVFDSSKRLLEVLNSLLDFSKLEAGKIETESLRFSLRKLVEETVALVTPNAAAKEIYLATIFAAGMPEFVMGDETKIRQVLLNYVHNAVKFTRTGSIVIEVSIDKSETETENAPETFFAKLSVTDTGIGISKEAQQGLFEPFVQADGSTRRRYGGSGLGLSIAKRFVEVLQGATGFKSEEGVGSTFWFTVKLDRAT